MLKVPSVAASLTAGLALLGQPSQALTTEVTATETQGNITAVLSYRQEHINRSNPYQPPCVKAASLIIRHNNQVLVEEDLAVSRQQVRDAYPNPDSCLDQPITDSLAIQDLDEDGTSEVWFHLGDNGLYCCGATRVYGYDDSQQSYSIVEKDWGDAGVALRDGQQPGQAPVFASGDRNFGWPFGPPFDVTQRLQSNNFGGGVMPLQVWQYSPNGFSEVTQEHRSALYSHATILWGEHWQRVQADGANYQDPRMKGIWAVYLADKYTLGEGEEGWQIVRANYQAPDREAFFDRLQQILRTHGYSEDDG